MLIMIYTQIGRSTEIKVTHFPDLNSRANTPIEVQIIHNLDYLAKICVGSWKDLNSSAFPQGSRKNMVACSPTSPLNLM